VRCVIGPGIDARTVLHALAIYGTLYAPRVGIHFVNRFGQDLRIGFEWQGQVLKEMSRMAPENRRIANTGCGVGEVFNSQVMLKADWHDKEAQPVEMLLGCEAAIMLAGNTTFASEPRSFPAGKWVENTAALLNCVCETLLAPAMQTERGEAFDSAATVLRHPVNGIDFQLDLASNSEKHWKDLTAGQLARATIFGVQIYAVNFSPARDKPEIHLNFVLTNLSSGWLLEARHLVASGKQVEELLKPA